VAATETARAELMAADLSGLDLVALMVDGVNFAGHCCVVAVGIDIDGVTHPLGVVEGDTENARLVTDLWSACESGDCASPRRSSAFSMARRRSPVR
jgi:putative transposase